MKPILLASLFVFATRVATAQDSSFADPSHFAGRTGAEVYHGICQGCHMPEGQGTVGAGMYPPLAKNQNLESSGYPIYLIIHGQKAMPPLGGILADDQIAAVVEYIRTHFGNVYVDPVTLDEVAGAR